MAIGDPSLRIGSKTPGRYPSTIPAKEYGILARMFSYPMSISSGMGSHTL